MKFLKFLVCFSTCILITSCGGGGGGGGGGGSSSRGVRILHGAVELSQVDAVSSLNEAGEAFASAIFGNQDGYMRVPNEEQTIRITTHNNASDTIGRVTLTVENRHTILVYGTESTTGNKVKFFNDDPGEFVDGSGKVRLLHGVAAASGLDILIDGTPVASAVGFGGASAYIDVTAGAHTVLIRRTADRKAVFSGTLTFDARRSYTLFAGGEVGYFTFGRFLLDG